MISGGGPVEAASQLWRRQKCAERLLGLLQRGRIELGGCVDRIRVGDSDFYTRASPLCDGAGCLSGPGLFPNQGTFLEGARSSIVNKARPTSQSDAVHKNLSLA
jgi:hypothetical protein